MKSEQTQLSLLGKRLASAHARAWMDSAVASGEPLDVQLRITKEELVVEVVNYETGEVLECCHWR